MSREQCALCGAAFSTTSGETPHTGFFISDADLDRLDGQEIAFYKFRGEYHLRRVGHCPECGGLFFSDLPSLPATVAISSQSGEERQLDPDEDEDGQFRECPTCAAKPGCPTLCASCLSRRDAYYERKKHGTGTLAFTVVPEGSIQEKARITPDGQATLYPGRTAPHVKVTEVVGRMRWRWGEPTPALGTVDDDDEYGPSLGPGLVPPEAHAKDDGHSCVELVDAEPGPRGRFRIEVSFWPSEVAKLPDDDDPYWDRRRR